MDWHSSFLEYDILHGVYLSKTLSIRSNISVESLSLCRWTDIDTGEIHEQVHVCVVLKIVTVFHKIRTEWWWRWNCYIWIEKLEIIHIKSKTN